MTSSSADASVHASAVRIGDRAVLIRGPSGSGKSRLAFNLILASRAGLIPSATLVGDDRIRLTNRDGILIARTVPELAGMIEVHGLGIRHIPFLDEAPVALVVDLDAADAARLPSQHALRTAISGIDLPRIPVAAGCDSLALVLAFLTTT